MPSLGFLLSFSRTRRGGGLGGQSAFVLQNMTTGCGPPQSDRVPRSHPLLMMAEARRSGAHPWKVVGGQQHSMACEAQTRSGWGGPGGRQSHRQTWSPLSNIRQQGVVLATCQARDQELGG